HFDFPDIKVRRLTILPMLVIIGCSGADSPATPARVPVATVTIVGPTGPLIAGATRQLSAMTRDAAGNTLNGRAISWKTSDASKALVSDAGLVTAAAPGQITITATSEGIVGTASIPIILTPIASLGIPDPGPVSVRTTRSL